MTEEELLLQKSFLADVVDSNPNMVEAVNERKNKTLSKEYFTSNTRTIVNAINKTYKDLLEAVSKSDEAVSLVKSLVGNTETTEDALAFGNLTKLTEKPNLIQMLDKISATKTSVNDSISIVETYDDISGESAKLFYCTSEKIIYYWDGSAATPLGTELEQENIDFDTEW